MMNLRKKVWSNLNIDCWDKVISFSNKQSTWKIYSCFVELSVLLKDILINES
jgi:hypothetical protein